MKNPQQRLFAPTCLSCGETLLSCLCYRHEPSHTEKFVGLVCHNKHCRLHYKAFRKDHYEHEARRHIAQFAEQEGGSS